MDALVAGQVALTVIQWSGAGRQQVSLPWTRMRTEADVRAFSSRARAMTRAFIMSDTAVGDIVRFSLGQFSAVPDCARHVIDISGDGTDNAGTDPQGARLQAEMRGVQINALAIEGIGVSITGFFRRNVITRDGFVMTARGHSTYAETLRRKIKREVSQVMF
jgi:Ca-activated chloride channel family protein